MKMMRRRMVAGFARTLTTLRILSGTYALTAVVLSLFISTVSFTSSTTASSEARSLFVQKEESTKCPISQFLLTSYISDALSLTSYISDALSLTSYISGRGFSRTLVDIGLNKCLKQMANMLCGAGKDLQLILLEHLQIRIYYLCWSLIEDYYKEKVNSSI